MHIICCIDIALINVMTVSLSVLHTSGKSKGFQSVFINRLAPKGVCLSVDVIMIGCTFVIFRITSGLDMKRPKS